MANPHAKDRKRVHREGRDPQLLHEDDVLKAVENLGRIFAKAVPHILEAMHREASALRMIDGAN